MIALEENSTSEPAVYRLNQAKNKSGDARFVIILVEDDHPPLSYLLRFASFDELAL